MKISAVMKKEKPNTQNKGIPLNPALELVLFAIIQILIFVLLYQTVYKMQYSATVLYFDYASKVLHGSLPYGILPWNIRHSLYFSSSYPGCSLRPGRFSP